MTIHGTAEIGCFELPEVSSVNRHDADEVMAYSHLLLSLLQRSDRHSCGVEPFVATRDLLPVAKEWLRTIREILPGIPSCRLIRLADIYGMLHLIVYNETASETVGRYYKEAFMTRVRGDHTVSETELFRAIAGRLQSGDRSFLGKYLDWYSRTLDRFFREFDKILQISGGSTFSGTAESLRKANILLSTDLFAFAGRGQQSFKSRLATLCRDALLDYKAMETDSPDTMQAKLLLLRENGCRIFSAGERALLEERLLASLSLAPSLHPLYRRAYLLDLSFRKKLVGASE